MRPLPLRIALAQLNTRVGDIDGNAAKIADCARPRARRGRRSSRCSPSSAINGYPPEDLLLKTHFLPPDGRALDEIAARASTASSRWSASPSTRDDVYNSLAVLADGEVQGRLPQDVPAQLRRLRRAALLPGRRRRRPLVQRRRRARRPDDLRGHLGARAAGQSTRRSPAPSDRQHLRLALPPGKGAQRERMLAQRARDNLARGRVLQPRRRPGRARLRRLQPGRSTRTASVIARGRSSRRS